MPKFFIYLDLCTLAFSSKMIWASTQQNLSLGFPIKRDSNQSPQLQRQFKLEDRKVLRHSPDLHTNVKIVEGQLQLIMEQILFYHIWGSQPFWSSDLNNLMNNPSNSAVISEKRCLDRYVAVQMSGLG